jgi:hypothetical protein
MVGERQLIPRLLLDSGPAMVTTGVRHRQPCSLPLLHIQACGEGRARCAWSEGMEAGLRVLAAAGGVMLGTLCTTQGTRS